MTRSQQSRMSERRLASESWHPWGLNVVRVRISRLVIRQKASIVDRPAHHLDTTSVRARQHTNPRAAVGRHQSIGPIGSSSLGEGKSPEMEHAPRSCNWFTKHLV